MSYSNIYNILNESSIIGDIKGIKEEIEDELNKNDEEVDKKKVYNLMLKQFYVGLGLSTGINTGIKNYNLF